MSKTLNSIIFYLFALGPFVAFFLQKVLNVAYYNLMAAFVFFAALIQYLEMSILHKKYFIPTYVKWFFLFTIYTIISDYVLVGAKLNIKYFYSSGLISSLFILLIVENSQISQKFINSFLVVNTIIFIIAFLVIFYQQLVDYSFFVDLSSENTMGYLEGVTTSEQRLPSIYSWMSLLEVSYSFTSLVAIFLSIGFMHNKKVFMQVILYLIGNIYAFITKNRWIMINSITLFLLFSIYSSFNVSKLFKYAIISLMLIYGSLIVLQDTKIPVIGVIQDRILENNSGGFASGSAGSRIISAIVFVKLFPNNPIFGKGKLHSTSESEDRDLEMTRELGGMSSQIHIGYLSLLYYYGIVGAFLFFLFLYHLMKKLKREAKISKFWGAYFAFLGFILSNFTLVMFYVFWAGFIIAMVFHRYYVTKSDSDNKIRTNEMKRAAYR